MTDLIRRSMVRLASREDKEHYFRFKCKHGYSMPPEEWVSFSEQCIQWVQQQVSDLGSEICLVVPESTNVAFNELISRLGVKVCWLRKRSAQEIWAEVSKQSMMKAERAKLASVFEGLSYLRVGQLAGNQRKRVIPVLFEPVTIDMPVVLLDDSCISGTTFEGMRAALGSTVVLRELSFFTF